MILFTLIKKETKEIIRDPVTLATGVFLPLIMLFLFGYAISLDVEDVSMAVYDGDRSQESVRFIEAFHREGISPSVIIWLPPMRPTICFSKMKLKLSLSSPPISQVICRI